MNDNESVVRKCPYKGCGWQIEVEKHHPNDEYAVTDAEHMAESHYHHEHCGEARVRVVLEKDMTLRPEQDLSDLLDQQFDNIDESDVFGFEAAFAYGEVLEESEGDRTVGTATERSGGDDG